MHIASTGDQGDATTSTEVSLSTDQQWDIVSGVGLTALAVAAGRAMESGRTDALMNDPYAASFVTEARPPVPIPVTFEDAEGQSSTAGLWPVMSSYVGVRSRAFDDYLGGALADGAAQVVVLASGLDTRAFRLPVPAATRYFELDQPAVLDFKLRVLKEQGAEPACDHRSIAADLRDDWGAALEEAGFDPSLPTAWLAEGLLPYLPEDAEERLLQEISRLSCPGSRLAVEQVSEVPDAAPDGAADPLVGQGESALGVDVRELLHMERQTPADQRLKELGWQTRNLSAAETAEGYGRSIDAAAFFADHVTHTFAELS